jgi:hypothetical protein
MPNNNFYALLSHCSIKHFFNSSLKCTAIMFDKKKPSNKHKPNFFWNWRKLPIRSSIPCVRHTDKTPYQELVSLNKTFSEGIEYIKDSIWPRCPVIIKTEENLEGEASCEKRSSFRRQNDSKGVEYGCRMGQTNFNNKYEHMFPKNPCEDLLLLSWKSNMNAWTNSFFTRSQSHVWFFFSQNSKVCTKLLYGIPEAWNPQMELFINFQQKLLWMG